MGSEKRDHPHENDLGSSLIISGERARVRERERDDGVECGCVRHAAECHLVGGAALPQGICAQALASGHRSRRQRPLLQRWGAGRAAVWRSGASRHGASGGPRQTAPDRGAERQVQGQPQSGGRRTQVGHSGRIRRILRDPQRGRPRREVHRQCR